MQKASPVDLMWRIVWLARSFGKTMSATSPKNMNGATANVDGALKRQRSASPACASGFARRSKTHCSTWCGAEMGVIADMIEKDRVEWRRIARKYETALRRIRSLDEKNVP